MRYAIYFTPAPGSPLAEFGRWWLGAPSLVDGLTAERWQEITASPRRYGFHATLKAPFALARGVDKAALVERMAAFAAGQEAFSTRPLVLGELGRFLALLPSPVDDPSLSALATACVAEFDSFRAPPADGELARRRASGLTARQDALLTRWGYPFVLDEFRFHMTLTEPLETNERRRVAAILAARLPETPLEVDGFSLFVEEVAGAPFRELARYSFNR